MKSLILLALSFAIPTTAFGQSSPCRTTHFTTKLIGTDEFSISLGSSLQLRLFPLRRQWGWTVKVSPDSDSAQDWTYPVNMPLRTGEAQVIGTGYGETVRNRLRHKHSIRFLLRASEFEKYSQLAIQTLESSDTNAAGRYLAELPTMPTGLIEITPLDSDTSSDGERVSWARFKIQVTVPNTFETDPKLRWQPSGCPSN